MRRFILGILGAALIAVPAAAMDVDDIIDLCEADLALYFRFFLLKRRLVGTQSNIIWDTVNMMTPTAAGSILFCQW